jgi:hypothetical protein
MNKEMEFLYIYIYIKKDIFFFFDSTHYNFTEFFKFPLIFIQ